MIQTMKHSGPTDRIAKRFSAVPTFEEFAELFNIKLDPNKAVPLQSKPETSKEKPRDTNSSKDRQEEKNQSVNKKAPVQNTPQNMSKAQKQLTVRDNVPKPSVSPKPKIRPASIIQPFQNAPSTTNTSRPKDSTAPPLQGPPAKPLSRLGVPTSMRVSPRPISPPSPIAKSLAGKPTRNMPKRRMV